ncbi:hypothetical protein KSF78_0007935 [Schistosoma japonicum]|nr:hypothetical protein KSF78_0007935 [Schistosoma japonicum]
MLSKTKTTFITQMFISRHNSLLTSSGKVKFYVSEANKKHNETVAK